MSAADAPGTDAVPPAASRAAISVIMPVYDGADVLPRSLPPLAAMRARGEILELLVVDDGSTDRGMHVALAHGARVLPSGGRRGPGGARNVGAQEAAGDILWFVDADVVVHDDAARVLAAAMADPHVAAAFGAYDDRPAGPNFLSQYKNLVHHHYHAREGGDARTFWAGCGAVRKELFLAHGGFDALRYPYPSIEDIELGYRMAEAGRRIVLVPELQGTHLKVWRLGNLLQTDVLRRAVPWSRLILARGRIPDVLNVGAVERRNAVLGCALALVCLLALARLVPAWAAAVLALVVLVANRELLATFVRARGVTFALAAVLFHQVYYVYSTFAFAWCWVERRLRRPEHG